MTSLGSILPPEVSEVREPRRPLHPTLSGTAVLEAPPEETRDVWAVGEENRR